MGNDSLNYIIIFCDLVGSSEVANELTPKDYANKYIKSFYSAGILTRNFIGTLKKDWEDKDEERIKYHFLGDEILVFKKIDNLRNCTEDVITAISFAYTLKLYWLVSSYTRRKILMSKPPREISCGIHIGGITEVKLKKFFKEKKFASYDINIAKRVETISREGFSSNVFVTNYVAEVFNKWRKEQLTKDIKTEELRLLTCAGFNPAEAKKLKGIAADVYVTELIPNIESHKKDPSAILEALKKRITKWHAHKTLKKWVGMLLESRKSPFANNSNREKYLNNLTYLARCSANLWFNFNVFYVAIALTDKSDKEILKEINAIHKYLQENIPREDNKE